MRRGVREWLVLAGTLVVVFGGLSLFGLMSPDHALRGTYLLGVAMTVAIYALLALGLSVEMGYAGLLNFGHVAFMGLGAYGAAVFVLKQRDAVVPALQGAQPWAFAVIALIALCLGFLVYALALQVAQRFAKRRRVAIGIAAALGLAAAIYAGATMYPLGPRGALNATVFLGVLIGIAASTLAGLVVGLAGLRLREDYLAIATLGFSQVVFLLTLNEADITNGSQGIQSVPRPIFDWATHTQWMKDLAKHWNVLPTGLANAAMGILCVAIAFVLLETLARAPWGRVLKAIREDEDVAASLGKNALLYKLQALMIGSALAAVAGILFIWNVASVVPEDFLAIVTFYSFAILVLGGVGNHKGAIVGAILIWGIFELAGNLTSLPFFTQHHIAFAGPPQAILVGLVLILVVMLRPQGLVGSKEEMSLGK